MHDNTPNATISTTLTVQETQTVTTVEQPEQNNTEKTKDNKNTTVVCPHCNNNNNVDMHAKDASIKINPCAHKACKKTYTQGYTIGHNYGVAYASGYHNIHKVGLSDNHATILVYNVDQDKSHNVTTETGIWTTDITNAAMIKTMTMATTTSTTTNGKYTGNENLPYFQNMVNQEPYLLPYYT